ncbi:MAG: DUF5606 domain-containing protein [Prevotellaceae bacterium]|jgi:hypothetical protein|nr:DUF5606 domain-containing protein [Prevotellaceae bacterium]
MQVDLQKILSASGYPGLYKYLSQGRQGVIVESLLTGKRSCLPQSAKVSSLSDITIFTNNDDMLLQDVFVKIRDKENGGATISSKSTSEEMIAYFTELIPEYDKNRVFPSHMKKLVEWYNLLQQKDLLDFVEKKDENKEEKDENIQ